MEYGGPPKKYIIPLVLSDRVVFFPELAATNIVLSLGRIVVRRMIVPLEQRINQQRRSAEGVLCDFVEIADSRS
jgi:hypothetical protein